MNDNERAALVDELAEAMRVAMNWEDDSAIIGIHTIATGKMATACLPIIERHLAAGTAPEVGLDELLDIVGGEITETGPWPSGGYEATIVVMTGTHGMDDDQYTEYHGTAPTRMDAIRNAVAAARSDRDGKAASSRDESFIIATDANGVTRSTTTIATQGDATDQNGED